MACQNRSTQFTPKAGPRHTPKTRRGSLLHARRKCECEGTTLTSGRKWQSVQHRRSQQAPGCRGTQFAYPSSPDRLGVHNAGSGGCRLAPRAVSAGRRAHRKRAPTRRRRCPRRAGQAAPACLRDLPRPARLAQRGELGVVGGGGGGGVGPGSGGSGRRGRRRGRRQKAAPKSQKLSPRSPRPSKRLVHTDST